MAAQRARRKPSQKDARATFPSRILRSTSAKTLGKVSRYFFEKYSAPANKAELRIALDRDPVALL